ncbi:hypothetical protein FNH05_15250 [Amycolatopsis rhizosphaerae]|uniref:Uncharacterized protein n=1 Tax=Amycolatopsis rhizosphaerae TaxID=2053003 RepID=A0A558CPM3_9PSEU|nr:hypothetical protein [Amycolatopsis rhizosphaerae]TVT50721.1 hypothetical protein FNH05_15250 [Amycolatopsis rhizosphaerae]
MDDLIPAHSYAPDGLYESDIDALLAEYFPADEQLAAPVEHLRPISSVPAPIGDADGEDIAA